MASDQSRNSNYETAKQQLNMTNSNKKKRAKQQQDFAKKKLKVGKVPSSKANATNLSFQSQAILLPTQSVLLRGSAESSTAPEGNNVIHELISHHNHTPSEVLARLSHHNSTVQKEALEEVLDLVQQQTTTVPDQSSFLRIHLHALIQKLCPILVGEDGGVRKVLVQTLSALFPFIPETELRPFFSILLAYVTSAMTHIFEDIRLDSIKVLDLLFEYYPGAFVTKQTSSSSALRGYSSLLSLHHSNNKTTGSGGATSSQIKGSASIMHPHSKSLHSKSRASILKSICSYLRLLSCHANENTKGCHSKSGKYLIHNHLMIPVDRSASELPYCASTKNMDEYQNFIVHLVPVIQAYWMECAASVFHSARLDEGALQVLLMCLRILETLFVDESLRSCIQTVQMEKLMDLILQEFPFVLDIASGESNETKHIILEMNYHCCALVSEVLRSCSFQQPNGDLISKLVSFLKGSLLHRSRTPLPFTQRRENFRMLCNMFSRLFMSSANTDKQGLESATSTVQNDILQVFLQAGISCDSPEIFDFFLTTLSDVLYTDVIYGFIVTQHVQFQTLLRLFPRRLWEWTPHYPQVSAHIIIFIRQYLSRYPINGAIEETSSNAVMSWLCQSLVPFFYPPKLACPGPFGDAPSTLQREMIALLHYIPGPFSDSFLIALVSGVISSDQLEQEDASSIMVDLVNMICARQELAELALPLEVFAGLLVSLLFASQCELSAGELRRRGAWLQTVLASLSQSEFDMLTAAVRHQYQVCLGMTHLPIGLSESVEMLQKKGMLLE